MTGDVRAYYLALGVELAGRGTKNVLIRCPFNPAAHSHGDKTKSCNVSIEHGAFHCKGCDAKGSVYDAAILLGHTPRDTMELLRRFGLREDTREKAPRKRPQARSQAKKGLSVVPDVQESPAPREPLRAGEEDLARWRDALAADEPVLARLAELRGWTREAIVELGLGWDGERVVIAVRDQQATLVGVCRYQPDPALRDAQQGKPKIKADVNSQRELFPAPELYSGNGTVLLLEGETCVPAARTLGLPAVGYPGLGGWKAEWSARFAGRSVCLIPDASPKGREKATDVAHDLYQHVDEVRVLDLFERERTDDADLTDWLLGNGGLESATSREQAAKLLLDMVERAPKLRRGATRATQVTLAEVVATYRRWIWLPDTRPLLAALGAAAANYLDGDPVWLLLVGGSGSGKTQIVEPLRRLPAVHSIATLTEASLLSGSSRKDRSEESTGGILREIGRFGMIMFKDFTSVLSMDFTTRDRTLSALREIYDGHYTRPVGSDGGRQLYWPDKDGPKGKVGVIGGVTDAIDQKQAISGAMGERLLLFRLARQNPISMSLAALEQGTENDRRDAELEAAVEGLFAYGPPRDPEPTNGEERMQIAGLAMLCAYCRSGVVRDRIHQHVEDVNEPEVPTRLSRALQQLLLGLSAIGVGRQAAFAIVAKVAIDSVPGMRAAVLAELLASGDARMTTSQIAGALKRTDAKAVRRALEDLELHGVLEASHEGQGKATEWWTSGWIRPFALLTQSYAAAGNGLGETPREPLLKLLETIRKTKSPENPLEIAISGALGSEWTDTFPTSLGDPHTPSSVNPPPESSVNPSPLDLNQDAGQVPPDPLVSLDSKPSEVTDPSKAGFREVSFNADAWVREEGFKLTDDELVAELEERFGIPEQESFGFLDIAWNRRRRNGPAA